MKGVGGFNGIFFTPFSYISFDTSSQNIPAFVIPMEKSLFILAKIDYQANNSTSFLRCFTAGLKNGVFQKLNTFSLAWPCKAISINSTIGFYVSGSTTPSVDYVDDIVFVSVYFNSYYQRIYFKASETGADIYNTDLSTSSGSYGILKHPRYYAISMDRNQRVSLLAKTGYAGVNATLLNYPQNPGWYYPKRSLSASVIHVILLGSTSASLYSITGNSSGLTPSYNLSLTKTHRFCEMFCDDTYEYVMFSFTDNTTEIYRVFDTSLVLVKSFTMNVISICPTKNHLLVYLDDSTLVLDTKNNFNTVNNFQGILDRVGFYSEKGSYDLRTMEPFTYIGKETDNSTSSTWDVPMSYNWTFDGSLSAILLNGRFKNNAYSTSDRTAMTTR